MGDTGLAWQAGVCFRSRLGHGRLVYRLELGGFAGARKAKRTQPAADGARLRRGPAHSGPAARGYDHLALAQSRALAAFLTGGSLVRGHGRPATSRLLEQKDQGNASQTKQAEEPEIFDEGPQTGLALQGAVNQALCLLLGKPGTAGGR